MNKEEKNITEHIEDFKETAQKIEESDSFPLRMFLMILAVMVLMFFAGALLSVKWCDAQVEDRINLILNNVYETSPEMAYGVGDYMRQNNISNISEWSKQQYQELKDDKYMDK